MRGARKAACLLGPWLAGMALGGCPFFPPDDDMTSPPAVTPTPASPTPHVTPTAVPEFVTISGQVIAVDKATGEPLDRETYACVAGRIAVYAVQDPTDIVHPVGKMTLFEPGGYSIELPANLGLVYIIAVVDVDKDTLITSADMAREAVQSPVTVGTESIADVDITLDLGSSCAWEFDGPCCNGYDYVVFSGDVTYVSEIPTNIAVAAFRGDYQGGTLGLTFRTDSGPYSVNVRKTEASTSLVGYADADSNGLYEPCDPTGLAEGNPYPLDEGDTSGVDILIEGIGKPDLPVPLPYITVAGSVVVHDGYDGTPIVVTLASASSGILYGTTTIEGPGDFGLRVPAGLSGALLTAITDSNGDGTLDAATDASGYYGPFDLGTSSVGGIVVVLVDPVGATPTPPLESGATPVLEPTPVPEPTPVAEPTPVPDPAHTPTPAPNPEELPEAGISGTITYDGTAADGDILVVSVFTDTTMSSAPVDTAYLAPTFPQNYLFIGFNEVLETIGTSSFDFYVTAVLDVGGDLSDEVGPEDVFGVYTIDGTSFTPVTVTKGQISEHVDFQLGNWEP